jgi:hypothetical protein
MRSCLWIVAAINCMVGCQPSNGPAHPEPAKVTTPITVNVHRGSLVDFTTIGFADNVTFDVLFEGTIQDHPARMALVSDIAFDGVTAPDFPGRLNAWIDVWKQANVDKGIAWVDVVLPQPAPSDPSKQLERGKKGIGLIQIDFKIIDPHRSIRAAGQVIEGWVQSISGAASKWIKDRHTREARKSLLAGYHLSLVSLHGKAALLLTTDPIASIVEGIARYVK